MASEYILIGDEYVEVTADVVAEGRDAVVAFHRQQLVERKIPHVIMRTEEIRDGVDERRRPIKVTVVHENPVEIPAEIAAKGKAEIDAWAADMSERRKGPDSYAEYVAAQAKAAAEKPASPAKPPKAAAPPASSATTNPE